MTRTALSRRRGIRVLIGLAASALVVTSVSGCAVVVAQSLSDALGGGSSGSSGPSGSTVQNEPPSAPVTQGPGVAVGVHTLSVGDCLNDGFVDSDDTSSAAPTVPRIACSEPHDNEVFAVAQLTGSDYPGDDEVSDLADAQCTPAFEDYVGASYDDAVGLDMTWYLPSRQAWENGDRLVECEVYGLDENGDPIQLTGSVQGRGDEFISTSQS